MSKKSLTKNYLYNTLYRIFFIIVPLVTTPYIARVLSPNEVGINSYVSSVINIFTTIGLLGLSNYSVREIAYVRHDKEKTNRTFFELFFIRLLLFILTVIVYLTFAFLNQDYKTYYIIYIFTIIGTFIDTSWFFQGEEEFKLITIRSFIIKTISTASIFVLVRNEDDLPVLMTIYSLTTIISAAVLFVPLRKYLSRPNLRSLNIKKHVVPSIKLFLPQVATLLYCQMDKIMIGNITGNITETGFYNQAEKIINIPLAIITSLSTVLLPRISQEFMKKHYDNVKYHIENALQFSLMLALPLTFGIASTAGGLIPWFLGEEYLPVINILISLSITVIFIALSNVSGNQYLTATNNTKVLTVSYCFGAVIDLVLNLMLIPQFGANGAAIATIVTEMIVMVTQFASIKFIDLRLLFVNSVKYLVGSLLILSICSLCVLAIEPSPMLTAVQGVLGFSVYFIFLIVSRDKLFLKYASRLLHIKRKSKPSLLIVAPKISVGGMERALLTILKTAEITNNYDVKLIIVYSTDEKLLREIPRSIKIRLLVKNWNMIGKLKAGVLLALYYLKYIIQFDSIDASICYSHHHGMLARIVRASSRNSIVFIHTDLTLSRSKEMLSSLCRKMRFERFAKVICVSEKAKKSFNQIYPRYDGGLYVVYNLIDYKRIRSLSKEYSINMKKTCPVFLSVARHEDDNHKKISRIISATKRLSEDGYVFKVILIGDGREHKGYCESIALQGLTDYFDIVGRVVNPFPYFLYADALVISSGFEGYGIIIDEAKTLKLPIVTTNVADTSIVVGTDYGIVCKNSTDGVYDGMKYFLDGNLKNVKTFDPKRFNLQIIKKLNSIILEDK